VPNDRRRDCGRVQDEHSRGHGGGGPREPAQEQIEAHPHLQERNKDGERPDGGLGQNPKARNCRGQVVEMPDFQGARDDEECAHEQAHGKGGPLHAVIYTLPVRISGDFRRNGGWNNLVD
jgi:hypothetical protein